MKILAMGVSLIRQWFPEATPGAFEIVRPRGSLSLVLDGTVGIARAGDERIEASIAGRIRAHEPDGAVPCVEDGHRQRMPDRDPDPLRRETRVEARRRSLGALAKADPFVWLQLHDDRGALTRETFLGRGVGMEYQVRAQFEVPTAERAIRGELDGHPRPRSALLTDLDSGLHARIVTRTYRNDSGPRYQMEVIVLTLRSAAEDAQARPEQSIEARPL